MTKKGTALAPASTSTSPRVVGRWRPCAAIRATCFSVSVGKRRSAPETVSAPAGRTRSVVSIVEFSIQKPAGPSARPLYSDGMNGVEFREVSFGHSRQIPILDGFTLAVDAGEVVALVGASGAGKTTALKLVNRLLLPDAGAVWVQGRDTSDWDPIRLRRAVGYVIQEVGLFPHLTVADN